MNANQVATTLLNRRFSGSPVIMQGELLGTLGESGMNEALRRRWIVPVLETGHLQVTGEQAILNQMKELAAEAPSETPGGEPSRSVEHRLEGRDYAMQHAGRPLVELLAPGTGHDNSAPMRPATPASPTSANTAGDKNYTIGEDVMVVENGQSYLGKVQKSDNGRYTVSFGDKKPAQPREYSREELTAVAKAQP